MLLATLRQSAAFGIAPEVVASCLDEESPGDELFSKGWRDGVGCLTRRERCAVAGVTGHFAESVVEMLLEPMGWSPLWHFSGPGRHGVDLIFLAPGDLVVAVEVKGSLVPGRTPPLSNREVAQMSATWVDKLDNPGMSELDLTSTDVYGGIAVVNFADLTWRVALTGDFASFHPVTRSGQLRELGWWRPGSPDASVPVGG